MAMHVRVSMLVLSLVAIMTIPNIPSVRPLEDRYIGAFFYPSYDLHRGWNASGRNPPLTWASHYLPDFKSAGFDPPVQLYDSSNDETIDWQLSLMEKATLDFVITSWWGPTSHENDVFGKILRISAQKASERLRSPRWCIVYEKETKGDPSVNEIVRDLKYVEETFGRSSAYFRLDGRLVVFVTADPDDSIAYAERWQEVRRILGNFYTVLKVFPGFIHLKACADSWFQYAPANGFELHEGFSAYVSPGFWKYDDAPIRERDSSAFARDLMRLRFATATFLLIETWNNWQEGNQIEPAYQVVDRGGRFVQASLSYGTTYIDLVRRILREEERLVASSDLKALVGMASSSLAAVLVAISAAQILRKEKKTSIASPRAA